MRLIGLAVIFIIALTLAPLAAKAQPAGKTPRIGVLVWFSPGSARSEQFALIFREGLRELGHFEGQNIGIEWRFADERSDRAAALATELVELGVDVIVANPGPAGLAAKNATRAVPIVLAGAGDAVASGLVASLARPGGNITGTSYNMAGPAGKHLELLREVLPRLARVAFLAIGDPSTRVLLQEMAIAAKRPTMQVQLLIVRGPEEFEGAFSAMSKERAEAVIVTPIVNPHFRRIVELAAKRRLATVSWFRIFPEAGGLMSYGPVASVATRRAAFYVDISKHVGRVKSARVLV
jgi:putative ABC transport system substrate-binding protein